ncbi:Type 1 glutamine amidotransferase-like domain-containing protein [Streptomyces sp. NPDC005731]|uniref:Type 1 glutamine amidotransferase-like domain-containing protein n=1 Tax=unclassified Streptomyces TaxID=2593676 RepID=UPI0033E72857
MELLLLSNSTAYGRTYLDHAMDPISEILNGNKEALFVPFALADHDGYTAQAAEALSPSGVTVTGAHVGDSIDLTREAEAIFASACSFSSRICASRTLRSRIPDSRRGPGPARSTV